MSAPEASPLKSHRLLTAGCQVNEELSGVKADSSKDEKQKLFPKQCF